MGRTSLTLLLVFGGTLATGCSDNAAGPVSREPMPVFETIDRGWASGYTQRGEEPLSDTTAFMIHDQDTWVRFWARHTRHRSPQPEAPSVDFAHSTVLALVDHVRSAVSDVEVVEITASSWLVEVHAERGIGCEFPATSQPYHIVAIQGASWSLAALHVVALDTGCP